MPMVAVPDRLYVRLNPPEGAGTDKLNSKLPVLLAQKHHPRQVHLQIKELKHMYKLLNYSLEQGYLPQITAIVIGFRATICFTNSSSCI